MISPRIDFWLLPGFGTDSCAQPARHWPIGPLRRRRRRPLRGPDLRRQDTGVESWSTVGLRDGSRESLHDSSRESGEEARMGWGGECGGVLAASAWVERRFGVGGFQILTYDL